MVYLVNTVVDFEITCENRLENEMRRKTFRVSSPLTRARKTFDSFKISQNSIICSGNLCVAVSIRSRA